MSTVTRFVSRRRSCRSFAANAVRHQLHTLAYNLGNFLRTLATPEPIKDWSLTTLKEKLIKIGAKVVGHARYVAFQMAEVAIPRNLFADILRMIAELRPGSYLVNVGFIVWITLSAAALWWVFSWFLSRWPT